MKNVWQLQEAKSKFSEVVNHAVLGEQPQIITKRGKDCVVIVSMKQFTKLSTPKESLKMLFQKAPKVKLDTERSKSKDRKINLCIDCVHSNY